ncbi:MAG: hypothetical protein MMC23_005653 [Stictis urceolatum]|nr:hypothetical protein [Stictis urceolata]
MSHQADDRRFFDERGYSGRLIHGEHPAALLDKSMLDRITGSYYWKEQCFGLNEATLCDRAADTTCIGATYGQQKPTPFICLVLKMLQMDPPEEIIREYLMQKEFKYLTALAAFYVRLTWEPKEIFETLEPLLGDWRKLRTRTREGAFGLTFLDQFVDDLLTKNRVCGTNFVKLSSRTVLEDLGVLEARVSALGDEVDELDNDEDESSSDNGSESGESHRIDRESHSDRRSRSPAVNGRVSDSED